MSLSALVLDPRDNVATAVRPLDGGEEITVTDGKKVVEVIMARPIPFGHKFALVDIKPGDDIVKYGWTVGRATQLILKGDHVHVHNVESLRGGGDLT